MLKAVVGIPGEKQLLVIGLTFGNIDKFKAEVMDTYIHLAKKDTTLPIDIYLFSGRSSQAIIRNPATGEEIIALGFSLDELDKLREHPGKMILNLESKKLQVINKNDNKVISGAVAIYNIDILIFSGVDEMTMAGQIDPLIGPETQVSIDSRFKH